MIFRSHPNRAFARRARIFRAYAGAGLSHQGLVPVSLSWKNMSDAGVAELADAPDLGSGALRRGGSSPSTRTI